MASGMVEFNKNKGQKQNKNKSNLESIICELSIHNVCIFPFVTDQIIVLSSSKCKKKGYTSKIVTFTVLINSKLARLKSSIPHAVPIEVWI